MRVICLTINVWQPDGVTKDSKLPVVVVSYAARFYSAIQTLMIWVSVQWIYGGM